MTKGQNKLAEAAERAVYVLAEIMDSHFGPHRHFKCTKCETMAVRVMDELNAALRASQGVGEVVVTTDEAGACVAVTRQDDEGRILKIIWKYLQV